MREKQLMYDRILTVLNDHQPEWSGISKLTDAMAALENLYTQERILAERERKLYGRCPCTARSDP